MTRKVSVLAATVISLACGTNVRSYAYSMACADHLVHLLRMGASIRLPPEPFRDAEQPHCNKHHHCLAGRADSSRASLVTSACMPVEYLSGCWLMPKDPNRVYYADL